MKKLVSFALAACLLLSLSGCGGWKSNQELCGYEVFPGTDWGMTPGEALKGLGLTKDDVELWTEVNPQWEMPIAAEWYRVREPMEVYGSPATLYLAFAKTPSSFAQYVGLFQLRAEYLEDGDIFEMAKQVDSRLIANKKVF